MPIREIIKTYLPAQAEAMADEHSELLCEGPVASGKSYVLVLKCLKHCQRYPGARALLLRRTKKDFDSSLAKTFKTVLLGGDVFTIEEEGGAITTEEATWARIAKLHPLFKDWIAKEDTLVMKNGSKIRFGYLRDSSGEVGGQVLSTEYSFIGICQAEELSSRNLSDLRGRLRYAHNTLGQTIKTELVMDCNPAGEDHPLYRDFFINPPAFRRKINFPMLDNEKNLDPAYVERIKNSKDEAWKARYILGKWGVKWEGIVFGMFSEIENRCDPPPNDMIWRVVAGVDWGYREKHFSAFCVWVKLRNNECIKVEQLKGEKLVTTNYIKMIEPVMERWRQWGPIIYTPHDRQDRSDEIRSTHPEWDILDARSGPDTKMDGLSYMQDGYATRRFKWLMDISSSDLTQYCYKGSSAREDTEQDGSDTNDADRYALFSDRFHEIKNTEALRNTCPLCHKENCKEHLQRPIDRLAYEDAMRTWDRMNGKQKNSAFRPVETQRAMAKVLY